MLTNCIRFRFLQPICLGGLVSYFARIEGITRTHAYWYATGIVLSTVLILVTYHPFYFFAFKSAGQVRIAISGLIYKKSLRLRKSCQEVQSGKIINLLSNDLTKLELALQILHFIWNGPLQTIVFLIVMYSEIGIAAILGIILLVISIPTQSKYKFHKITTFYHFSDKYL